jgi:hypothetical protein
MSRYRRTTPKRRAEPEWERVADTMAATSLSRQTIINKINDGSIDAVKSGSALLVNVKSRRDHFNSLPKARFAPSRIEAAE